MHTAIALCTAQPPPGYQCKGGGWGYRLAHVGEAAQLRTWAKSDVQPDIAVWTYTGPDGLSASGHEIFGQGADFPLEPADTDEHDGVGVTT